MAIAKIEPPSNFDMGSKVVPWKRRHAEGMELRHAIPRESHAEWTLWKGRPDPLQLLAASNKGRLADLIHTAYGTHGRLAFHISAGLGLRDGC